MYMSLAGNVVDNISDILLSAVADKVLLRSTVLQKHQQTDTQLIHTVKCFPEGDQNN